MTDKPDLISVVVPVYGCCDCLEDLADRVRDSFHGSNLNWELVLVDDRGPDLPWPLITDLATRDSRIRGVRLARNHGQHLAIWAGMATARGDWIAVIDCDLQDDPAIIHDLHAKALSDPELEAVVVDRGTWSDNWFRRTASRFFYKLIDVLAGVRLNNNIGNFGLYSRTMVDTLLQFREQEVFLPVMVALTGYKRTFLSHDRSGRAAGESSYHLRRLIQLAIAVVIRFSDRPLKLSVVAGFAFSTIAALISVIVVIAHTIGAITVPGWASVILSVWFLSGLILGVLGIHGFYLGRVFAEVKARPRILVEQHTLDAVDAPIHLDTTQGVKT